MFKKLIPLVLLVAIIVVYIVHPYYHPLSSILYNIAWYAIGILGSWVSFKAIIK